MVLFARRISPMDLKLEEDPLYPCQGVEPLDMALEGFPRGTATLALKP